MGGAAAEWSNASVCGCVEGPGGGGAGAAGCRGEHGGARHGDGKEGRGGAVICAWRELGARMGLSVFFLGFLMRGLVKHVLFENGREYRG